MPLKRFLPTHREPGPVAAGTALPPLRYGCLTASYLSSSHHPIRGNVDTPRHIFLALQVPDRAHAQGLYEAAVNIRSSEGTQVLFAERIEDVSSQPMPEFGFQEGVKLSYGFGERPDTTYMGLKDPDFQPIHNDALYTRISQLCQDADRICVHGVTYDTGDGIHDVHQNSGTAVDDPHHHSDRDREDGAIAFYVSSSSQQVTEARAHWIFIRFATQSVVGG